MRGFTEHPAPKMRGTREAGQSMSRRSAGRSGAGRGVTRLCRWRKRRIHQPCRLVLLPMRTRIFILLLTGLLAAPVAPIHASSTASPEDDEAIRAVVEAVFAGMYAGDAEALDPLFHPAAVLRIVRDDEVTLQPASDFIAQVGTPRDAPLDERFADLEIRIDGPLATAWMAYTMYIGAAFSHCGVNAMEFVRTDDRWQVLGVSYTRRTTDCLADL